MNDTPERIWAGWVGVLWAEPVWEDEQVEDFPEYIRADLTKPKVKPLEWVRGPGCWLAKDSYGFSLYEVRGPDGEGNKGYWKRSDTYRRTEIDGGLADAKACAQADYERRILSALENTWTP